jgi:hypothetical protein
MNPSLFATNGRRMTWSTIVQIVWLSMAIVTLVVVTRLTRYSVLPDRGAIFDRWKQEVCYPQQGGRQWRCESVR